MIKGKMTNSFHVLPDARGVPSTIQCKGAGRAFNGFPYRDEDTDTFLSRVTSIDKGRDELIYEFITGLKSDLGIKSLVEMFDFLYLFAQDTQANALLNLAQNAYNATINGAMTFTANRGFIGNSSSSGASTTYIDTGFVALSGTTATWAQNSASYGIYSRTDLASDTQVDMGGYNTSANSGPAELRCRNTGTGASFGINSVFTTQPCGITTSRGMFSVRRTGSVGSQMMMNGSTLCTFPSPSTSTSSKIIIGAQWVPNLPGANSPCARQIAMAFGGSGTINHMALYKNLQKYLSAIGAAV